MQKLGERGHAVALVFRFSAILGSAGSWATARGYTRAPRKCGACPCNRRDWREARAQIDVYGWLPLCRLSGNLWLIAGYRDTQSSKIDRTPFPNRNREVPILLFFHSQAIIGLLTPNENRVFLFLFLYINVFFTPSSELFYY